MSETLQNLGLVPFFSSQLTDPSQLEARLGRVTAVQRSRSTVVCATGERMVELSLGLQKSAAIDRPVVGDWIVLDESLARIDQVLERKSLFRR